MVDMLLGFGSSWSEYFPFPMAFFQIATEDPQKVVYQPYDSSMHASQDQFEMHRALCPCSQPTSFSMEDLPADFQSICYRIDLFQREHQTWCRLSVLLACLPSNDSYSGGWIRTHILHLMSIFLEANFAQIAQRS